MAEVATGEQRKEKVNQLIKALGKGLYEREEPVKLALLTAVAGESIFLLGPPGVGKSLIARRLKHAFKDGTSFEYLMSKFSTPDEVFGPISIKKLKDEDKYERNIENYMPSASVVFLDEIWKSSSAIQNALLTIINEKVYRNGEEEIKVNIKGLITASNELPPAAESFDPLWDRFLVRYNIGGIRKHKNFLRMITDTKDVYDMEVPEEVKLSNALLQEWSAAIDEIEVPEEVLNTIQIIRMKIEEYNEKHTGRDSLVMTYDRRWKKIIRLLRTAAFLNERNRVDLMDCFLMVHCLWNKPEQLETIKEIVGESIRKHGYSVTTRLGMVKRELDAFEKEVDEEIRIRHKKTEEQLKPYEDEYYELLKDNTQFEGKYVKLNDFNKLSYTNTTITNIYDEDKNLLNRLQAKKGEKEHTIEIVHNSKTYTFPMKTMKVEREEIVYKVPHRLVKQFWDERFEQLHQYIEEQEARLREEYPDELNHVNSNLFIDEKLAPIVKANHEEVVSALEQAKLNLEKLKYSYDNTDA